MLSFSMKIGFTAGAFDLCHVGHARMFKECKTVCDFLIVALQSDPSIDRANKHKPIQSVNERLEMLEAIRWIDQVVHYDTEEDLYNLLKEIRVDIRIIGEDWRDKKFTGYDLPIEMYYNLRDHHYSTSHFRNRVAQAEIDRKRFD